MRTMKFLAIGIVSTMLLVACQSNDSSNTSGTGDATMQTDSIVLAEMMFEEETYDFGNVQQGELVAYSFKFKNTSKSVLIISSAVASCGCTVPNYSEEPIQPGQEGIIEVEFNSAGRRGNQHKTITVTANIPEGTKHLSISGTVIVPE